MSSDTIPLDPQDFLSYVSANLPDNYISVAGLCWFAYDYLLTLSSEVEAIWKSKPSTTTVLFLINRYAFVFSWVLIVVSNSVTTNVIECRILYCLAVVANTLNGISVSGIFILRTYAICGQNKWVLGSLALLFFARFGLIIWNLIVVTRQSGILLIPNVDSVGNCVFLGSEKPIAIEIVLTVVFDTMVFILTVYRTLVTCRQAKAAGIKAELSALLLRDGSLYFGIVSVATILDAVTSFDSNLPVFFFNIVNLASPLEVILTNRLILNLRTHWHANDLLNPKTKTDIFFQQTHGGSHVAGRFQSTIDSVLGNIGAPLRVGDDQEDEEEDEFPSEDREHTTGMDPLSQIRSGRETVRYPDFRLEP